MHTIQDIRAEYNRLDQIMGIDSKDVEIRISDKKGRQLGCFYAPYPDADNPSSDPLCISIAASVLEEDDLWRIS